MDTPQTASQPRTSSSLPGQHRQSRLSSNQPPSTEQHAGEPRRRRPPRDGAERAAAAQVSSSDAQSSRNSRHRRRPKPNVSTRPTNDHHAAAVEPATTGDSAVQSDADIRPRANRRAKFNATLTESSSQSTASKYRDRVTFKRNTTPTPPMNDLTSNLIHALRTPPYPDCAICFSSVHPLQPSWSCSPSVLTSAREDPQAENAQCCWTTFHLKCIKSWASKSVKEVADAWRARGEDRPGEWRCPGCQMKRIAVPSGYRYVHFTP